MALPHFEVPAGPINGSNQIFTTSLPYFAGTTAVFSNGQLKRMDYSDGWSETNPAAGVVILNQAPLVGDVVQIFYIDSLPATPGTEVSTLQGKIEAVDDLDGVMIDSSSLFGVIVGI